MWQKLNCFPSQKLAIVSSNTEEGLDTQWDFSKINHILGSKVSLNKHQKNEITSWILSEHQRLMLPDNTKDRKFMSLCQFSNTCWTKIGWKEKSRKKMKILVVKRKWKHSILPSMEQIESNHMRKFIALSAYILLFLKQRNNYIFIAVTKIMKHGTDSYLKILSKFFFLFILKCFYIFE